MKSTQVIIIFNKFISFIFDMKSICFIILLITAYASLRTPQQDLVDIAISGYHSAIYSGQLLSSLSTDSIHYLMFASQRQPATDPLILWLTGGPGCSSFLATHYQNGPYVFKEKSMHFSMNEFAWNKKANLLYFETPQGVGFSQGSEITFTDEKAVQAAYDALIQFYQRFPDFKGRSLYLSGSGYAGIYLTQLSKLILESEDPESGFFNLKGVLLGNPCIKPEECWAPGSGRKSYYHYEQLYQHSFFTKQTWNYFKNICQTYDSYSCYQQRQLMDKIFNQTNTSSYNLNEKCYPEQSKFRPTFECQDVDAVSFFLNDNSIKAHFHFPYGKEWKFCNFKIFEGYIQNVNSYRILPLLLKNNIKLWVYSGELDSTIPLQGTKRWAEQIRSELSLPILRNWRKWYTQSEEHEQEIGGQVLQIQGLTLATVKSAGFRAALDRPNAMYSILEGFLGERPV